MIGAGLLALVIVADRASGSNAWIEVRADCASVAAVRSNAVEDIGVEDIGVEDLLAAIRVENRTQHRRFLAGAPVPPLALLPRRPPVLRRRRPAQWSRRVLVHRQGRRGGR